MFDGNNTQFYGQQQGGYNFAGMNPTAAQPIKNALTDEQIKYCLEYIEEKKTRF